MAQSARHGNRLNRHVLFVGQRKTLHRCAGHLGTACKLCGVANHPGQLSLFGVGKPLRIHLCEIAFLVLAHAHKSPLSLGSSGECPLQYRCVVPPQ